MNDLIRFDPFTDTFPTMSTLPDVFRGWARPLRALEPDFDIKVDVSETDGEYKVKANIPGVKKEDINVAVDGNIVSISAESKRETEQKDEKWLRTERHYGKVQRSFSLAQDIDSAGVKAKYDQGVLNLVLPKKAGSVSKQIAVQ
ncbi:MAG: Hsp20/alpha crystallin family protein [Betaproteobacteria bacterium]|nr:Hsp20/alpha crystallin family protein [Betaproteobacteria bacterium]